MEPANLTDILKDRLGLWKPDELTDDVMTRLWRELGLPGSPGPDPEPPPRPKCGFKELPVDDVSVAADRTACGQAGELVVPPLATRTPIMTPDEEAQYDAERDRAEQQRQEQARRLIWFGDLPIDPFPGLGV
jgi:predicted small lipoprotein YifL